MKKIITLFVATLFGLIGFAQMEQERANPADWSSSKNEERHRNDFYRYESRYENNRALSFKIARINRYYDDKIAQVQSRLFMRRSRKMELIYQLEQERKFKIRELIHQFEYSYNRNNHHGNRHH
ncbi:MAG: hypothetical protein RLY16_918 [Bacteroidota bacterium]|jgi:hypothetical protein